MPLAPSSFVAASTGGSAMRQLANDFRPAESESATLGGFDDEWGTGSRRNVPERPGRGVQLMTKPTTAPRGWSSTPCSLPLSPGPITR